MANYITRSDLERRLRRSYATLYTPPGQSAVDTDLVDADIDAAEAEVDGYLAKRYRVPVTDSAALRMCRAWSLVLAEELAYGAIPGRDLPESVSTRAKTAREQLAAAADGRMMLGSAETVAEAAGASEALVIEGETPVMTRTTLEGF